MQLQIQKDLEPQTFKGMDYARSLADEKFKSYFNPRSMATQHPSHVESIKGIIEIKATTSSAISGSIQNSVYDAWPESRAKR